MPKHPINAMSVLMAGTTASGGASSESEATCLLKDRSTELRRDVVEVTEGIYTATCSTIVGDDGVIIVDTTMTTEHANAVLAKLHAITAKPVKAIIYTHAHGDHTRGAAVFAAEGNPEIWGRANSGSEGRAFTSAGLTINNVRSVCQAGFRLPPDDRINNGIAPLCGLEAGAVPSVPGAAVMFPPTEPSTTSASRCASPASGWIWWPLREKPAIGSTSGCPTGGSSSQSTTSTNPGPPVRDPGHVVPRRAGMGRQCRQDAPGKTGLFSARTHPSHPG